MLSADSAGTYTRPIYAGNAIATVKSSDAKKVLATCGTAFEKAASEGGSASVETVSGKGDTDISSFVGAEIAKSERPALTSAKIIEPLANKLDAGVGASRAGRGLCHRRLSNRQDR